MQKLQQLLLIISCIAGIVLLNVGFIFLLLGFLPTVVAHFVDDTPNKDLYKTVRATNIAGILPTLITISKTSDPGASMQVAMSDPGTWLVVYGSAALGYLLIWTCRWVAFFSILAASEARAFMLEEAQKDLVNEWGEEIKEFVISDNQQR
jgi:hypothetical protein